MIEVRVGPDTLRFSDDTPEEVIKQKTREFARRRAQETVAPIPEPQGLPGPPLGEQIVRSGMQGMTANLSDEAVAAARSRLPGMRSYEEELALERGELARTPASVSIPSQIAGALLTAPMAVGAGAAARLGPVASGALAGAGGGAVGGFFAGEGGFLPRLASAGVGTALGAAAGGAMPLLGMGVRRGIRSVAEARGVPRAPGEATSSAERAAAGELAEAIQSDLLPRVATPTERAILPQAQLASRVAQRALARQKTLGPEALTLDVGGLNTRGVVRAAAGQPGIAKDLVERTLSQRQMGQQQRVINAARKALGTTRRFGDTVDDVIEQRAAQARPLYDAALAAQPSGGLRSSAVRSLIGTPKRGKQAATGNPTIRSIIKKVKGESPRLADLPDNSLEVMDEVYKELGARAASLRDRLNPQRSGTAAHRMDELRMTLRDALVAEVPEYGTALRTYSHDSNLLDALMSGRNVLRQEDYMTRKTVEGLSDAEKEMWLIGVAEGIQDIVERVQNPRDVTKKILGNRQVQNRLKAAIPSERAWREFKRELLREAEMATASQGARPTVGSQTALRQEEIADLIEPVRQVIRTATVFGAVPAAAQGGGRLLARAFRGRGRPEINEAIARIAMSPVSEGQRILADINTRALLREAASTRAARAGLAAGIVGGGQAAPYATENQFMQEIGKLIGGR